MALIIHFSTSHFHNDNRIYYKEILSARGVGFAVGFIVREKNRTIYSGCEIYQLKLSSNIFIRFVYNQIIGIYKIIRLNPDIVHFHDPELLFGMYLLSYFKKINIIYDVHEDNYTALLHRNTFRNMYLIRRIARIIRGMEILASKRFNIVVAEKYYQRVFPSATCVLNYPKLDFQSPQKCSMATNYIELIYTGNITQERGLDIYIELIKLNPKIRIHLVGRISKPMSDHLYKNLGDAKERLVIPYTDLFVDPPKILAYYSQYSWTAGLAVFPFSEHYYEKELTKIFEYMAVSIPVICSNFPTWEQIILPIEAGMSVDPQNLKLLSGSITELSNNPGRILKYGRNGYLAVRSHYQWETQADNMINLYTKIMNDHV